MTIFQIPMYFLYPYGIVISLSSIQSIIFCLPLFFPREASSVYCTSYWDPIHPWQVLSYIYNIQYVIVSIQPHTVIQWYIVIRAYPHPHTSAACYFSYSGAYKPSAWSAPTKLAGQIPVTGHPAASTALGHREREGGWVASDVYLVVVVVV